MAARYSRYRQLVTILRQHCAPAYPISVRRIVMPRQLDGRCWKEGKKFVIEIDKNLDEARAIEVLLHEWAHARAWNHLLDTADAITFNRLSHDAAWGVAYAEVYAAFEQKFIPDSDRI